MEKNLDMGVVLGANIQDAVQSTASCIFARAEDFPPLHTGAEDFPPLPAGGGRKVFRPCRQARPCSRAAWAAAKRAIGTLNGEQLT